MSTARTADLVSLSNLRREIRPAPLLVALAALVAFVVGARLPAPYSLAPIALWVCLLAFAAFLWPAGTLLVAMLGSLADPTLVPALARPDSTFGAYGFTESLLLGTGIGIGLRAALAGRFVDGLRDRALLAIAAYVVVALISAAVNRVPIVVAGAGIASTVDAMAILFLARMAVREELWLRRAVLVFLALMGVAALIAVAQRLLAPNILGFRAFPGGFHEGGRATGFLGNPNHLAPLLGLAVAYAIFGFRALSTRWAQIAALLFIYLLTLALVLTFSRSGWLSFALGTAAVAIAFDRRALAITLAVGVVALATALYMPREILIPQPAEDAQPDLLDLTVGRYNAISEGQDLRSIFIVESLPVIAHDPLIGVGPGRFGGAAANVFGTPVYAQYGVSLYRFHTIHDYWLHQLAEVGVLGTLAIAGLMALLIVRLARAARRASGITRALLVATAAGTLAMSLNSLTEMILEGNSPSFVLWLFIGLASVAAERLLARSPLGDEAAARP